MGSEKDIAEAVNFLAHSQYITGQIIKVDGGRSL
jgi:NAD(P)-dependent dehydrogenase (short-subunit alcohol dehydrogenase family)